MGTFYNQNETKIVLVEFAALFEILIFSRISLFV